MGKIIVNAGMAEIDDNKLIVNNPLSVEVGELNSPTKKSIGTKEEQIKEEKSINIDELSERIGKVVGENTKVEEKEKEEEKEEEEKEEEKKEEEKVQEEKQPDAPNTPEQEESNVLDGEDDMII